MATYFQSLNLNSVDDAAHTVSGSFTSTDGTTLPDAPYNLSILDVTTGISAPLSGVSFSGGSLLASYDPAQLTVSNGDSVELVTTDTPTGNPLVSNVVVDSSVVTGGPTPNVGNDGGQALQDFLSSLNASFGTLPVTQISGSGSLSSAIGVVTPGSNVTLNVASDAAIFESGNSTLDLSNSPLLNVTGRHLSVKVQIGDGANTVTLNHGPSIAQSTTGNDTLVSGGGHDTLSSGFGHDSMVGGGHSMVLGGSAGGDTLRGGLSASSHDTLVAGLGGDLITTKFGHNVIYGNENDTIIAGLAQDTIDAGYSPETVIGGLHSTITGGGLTLMKGGIHNVYNATGSDTINGSNFSNTVNITDGSNGVVVDGRTGTGALDVNVNTKDSGNDTLFGGTGADGTGSNLTIHVTQSFTEQQGVDANGLHTVQLAGGQTLHVSNVTIDFNGTKTSV